MQLHKERVLHIAGRMLLGKVKRSEHVPVVFDIGTGNGRVTNVFEDATHLIHHNGDRMHGAHGNITRRTGHIGDAAMGTSSSLKFASVLLQTLLCFVFQLIDHLPERLTLFGGNILDLTEH